MPEEQNRRITDHLSSWLFCPTSTAIENLKKEGIFDSGVASPDPDHKSVTMSGDVMLDASLHYRKKALSRAGYILKGLPDVFYLLTIHRAENTDDPVRLGAIVSAINAASDKPAVFPIHPRTKKIMSKHGLSFGSHVHLLDPVGYYEMLCLEDACSSVLTDSGGVQKEAFFFGKPCATMRDSTEWVELVDAGWNVLVGADQQSIVKAIYHPLQPSSSPALYGAGDAGTTIITCLLAE